MQVKHKLVIPNHLCFSLNWRLVNTVFNKVFLKCKNDLIFVQNFIEKPVNSTLPKTEQFRVHCALYCTYINSVLWSLNSFGICSSVKFFSNFFPHSPPYAFSLTFSSVFSFPSTVTFSLSSKLRLSSYSFVSFNLLSFSLFYLVPASPSPPPHPRLLQACSIPEPKFVNV